MEFLTYIIKSAGILTLFYLIYLLVLRKDTFFTANRTYLLMGIIAAIVLPFITFTTITLVDAPVLANEVTVTELAPLISATTEVATESAIDVWQFIFWGYLAGVGIMLFHFLVQLASLLNLLRKYPSIKKNGVRFVEIKDDIAPFSFFSYIVFNPKTHDSDELEMILRHEKVHASQWHSIDLLLANLVRACQWANPISWFYKASLEANLEFLADNETARYVPSKTAYQLALLKASSPLPVPALTNNFYHSFIKKRIIMLNKSNSNKYNQLKLTLVLPALALFLWSFNTVEVVKYKTTNTDISSGAVENEIRTTAALTFSAISSNEELDALEAFFVSNHPESLVKIANRKRDANGNLVNFSFKTKFTGNDRFYTRFDRSTGAPFKTVYKVEPQDNATILVSELGTDGAQFKITKENLEFLGDVAFGSAKSSNAKTAKEPIFGDNPLYIVNGKEYYANQLPKDKTIELDGRVEAFNQKEGKEKYGEKGKDGVLLFNGVSTFAPTKTAVSETPVSEEKTVQKDFEERSTAKITDVKEVRIKITKNTTKEQLETIKKELKRDHDITFNYKNIDYNANNEITSIAVSYKGKGMNGSYSVTDDDGGAIDDFYFYMDTNKGTSGFGSENMKKRREAREEIKVKRKTLRSNINKNRIEKLENRRNELAEEREELRNSERERRFEKLESSRNELAEVREKLERTEEREELIEERKQMRKEVAKLRQTQSNIREEERKIAKEYARVSRNYRGSQGEKIVITKNTSDAELAKMKIDMQAKGFSFKYSKVKRNANGEITRIKIDSDNNNGSKQTITTNTHGDDAIDEIVIEH